jgi:hypothetical protein
MIKEFKGVWIPKAIYQDEKLTPTDKLVLSDIFNLCNEGGKCFKTNETIAKEVNISIPSVSRTIKKLINLNYIKCEYNGRLRLIKMIGTLIKMIKQPNQIDKAAISKRLDSIHSSTQLSIHSSKEEGVKVIYPFNSDEFRSTWALWLSERKEKKLKKYTSKGLQAQLHHLQQISKNNEAEAIKIINYSIAQGWQGLFPLKKQKGGAPEITQNTLDWINKGSR